MPITYAYSLKIKIFAPWVLGNIIIQVSFHHYYICAEFYLYFILYMLSYKFILIVCIKRPNIYTD